MDLCEVREELALHRRSRALLCALAGACLFLFHAPASATVCHVTPGDPVMELKFAEGSPRISFRDQQAIVRFTQKQESEGRCVVAYAWSVSRKIPYYTSRLALRRQQALLSVLEDTSAPFRLERGAPVDALRPTQAGMMAMLVSGSAWPHTNNEREEDLDELK